MPEPMLTASVMFANAARFADAYQYRHRAAVRVDGAAAGGGRHPAVSGQQPRLRDGGRDLPDAGDEARARVVPHRPARERGLSAPPARPRRPAQDGARADRAGAAIVAEGRELQRAFADRLAEGLSAEDLRTSAAGVAIFDRNIEQIRAEKSKRTEIQNP